MGEIYLWLSFMCWGKSAGAGEDVGLDQSRRVVRNFFNRSPITLKFGAEKLERESQERESESESEREQVVVFTFASCCCSTLVS
jgi:hypothetical protein